MYANLASCNVAKQGFNMGCVTCKFWVSVRHSKDTSAMQLLATRRCAQFEHVQCARKCTRKFSTGSGHKILILKSCDGTIAVIQTSQSEKSFKDGMLVA